MDMTQRIEDLILISEHLVRLLQDENTALVKKNYETVAALVDKKDTLCRAFEQRAVILAKLKNELHDDGIDRQRLETVHDLGKQIHDLIEENANMLRASIEANNLVLSLFAQAVKESKPGPGTYSAGGNLSDRALNAPNDMAISFDKSL